MIALDDLKEQFKDDFKKMSKSDIQKLDAFLEEYTDQTVMFYSTGGILQLLFRYLFSKYPKLIHTIIKNNMKAASLILEGVATEAQIKRMVSQNKFKEFIEICDDYIDSVVIDLAHKSHNGYRLSESDFSTVILHLKKIEDIKKRRDQQQLQSIMDFLLFICMYTPKLDPYLTLNSVQLLTILWEGNNDKKTK